MLVLRKLTLFTILAVVLPLVVVASRIQNDQITSQTCNYTMSDSSIALEHLTHLTLPSVSQVKDAIERNQTNFSTEPIKSDNVIYITAIPGVITNPLTIYLTVIIRPRSRTELYMFVSGVTAFLVVILRMIYKTMPLLKYTFTEVIGKLVYFFNKLSVFVFKLDTCCMDNRTK